MLETTDGQTAGLVGDAVRATLQECEFVLRTRAGRVFAGPVAYGEPLVSPEAITYPTMVATFRGEDFTTWNVDPVAIGDTVATDVPAFIE